jgi:hypothetical protein
MDGWDAREWVGELYRWMDWDAREWVGELYRWMDWDAKEKVGLWMHLGTLDCYGAMGSNGGCKLHCSRDRLGARRPHAAGGQQRGRLQERVHERSLAGCRRSTRPGESHLVSIISKEPSTSVAKLANKTSIRTNSNISGYLWLPTILGKRWSVPTSAASPIATS